MKRQRPPRIHKSKGFSSPFKFLLISLICSSLTLGMTASLSHATELTLEFPEVAGNSGPIQVALFSSRQQADFPFHRSPSPLLCFEIADKQPQGAVFRCDDLTPGRYAVFAYQDTNRNGQIDHHWYGPPKEGIGFSNQASPGLFGPPKFDQAAFELHEKPLTITIRLRPF